MEESENGAAASFAAEGVTTAACTAAARSRNAAYLVSISSSHRVDKEEL